MMNFSLSIWFYASLSHIWQTKYSIISGRHEILESVVSRTLWCYVQSTQAMISLGSGVGGLVGHLGVVRLVHVGIMVVYICIL